MYLPKKLFPPSVDWRRLMWSLPSPFHDKKRTLPFDAMDGPRGLVSVWMTTGVPMPVGTPSTTVTVATSRTSIDVLCQATKSCPSCTARQGAWGVFWVDVNDGGKVWPPSCEEATTIASFTSRQARKSEPSKDARVGPVGLTRATLMRSFDVPVHATKIAPSWSVSAGPCPVVCDVVVLPTNARPSSYEYRKSRWFSSPRKARKR